MVRRKFSERKKSWTRSIYDMFQTPDLVFRLALLGLNNNEIAATIQIPINTFEGWLMRYPVLIKKLREGKKVADSKVAQSLYKRATGFSVDDNFIAISKGEPVIIPIKKYFPPNTSAAIFWLKNRTRDNGFSFVDKMDFDMNRKETIVLDLINTDLSDFTEDEIKVVKKYIGKSRIEGKESKDE